MFAPKSLIRRLSLLVATVILVATRGIAAPVTLADMENRYDPYFEARGPVKSITYTSEGILKQLLGYIYVEIKKVNYLPTGERWFVLGDYGTFFYKSCWEEKDNSVLSFSESSQQVTVTNEYVLDAERKHLLRHKEDYSISLAGIGCGECSVNYHYDENSALTSIELEQSTDSPYSGLTICLKEFKVGKSVEDSYGNWICREFYGKEDTIVVTRSINYYSQEELNLLLPISYPENLGLNKTGSNNAFIIAQNAARLGDVDAQCAMGGADNYYSNNIAWLQRAAATGHAESMSQLGKAYLEGDKLKKDTMRGVSLLQQSVDLGCVEGMADLGLMYYNDTDGMLPDYEKAVELLKKSLSTIERPDVLYTLAWCYYFGRGVEENDSIAAEYFYRCSKFRETTEFEVDVFEWAVGLGHAQAMVEKGLQQEQGTEKALHWFQKAADLGYPAGQYQLGRYYELMQMGDKMLEMYNAAASQGNVDAMAALGRCYYEGDFVVRNYDTAFKLIHKAWEMNPDKASLNVLCQLALCYEKGYGVKQDLNKAGKLYYDASFAGSEDDNYKDPMHKAAELGYEEAIEEIVLNGSRYFYTYDDTDELDEFIAHLPKENGFMQNKLGCEHYDNGNYEEAVKCFSKALNMGSHEAWYRLGKCCFAGTGVPQDYSKARKMLEFYCDEYASECPQECYRMLGEIYERGYGVKIDLQKAEMYYLKADDYRAAARIGNVEALKDERLSYWSNDEEFQLFRKAVDTGQAWAQYEAGIGCIRGEKLKQNTQLGLEYLLAAADQGHLEAQKKLAMLYLEGRVVDVSYSEAVKWLALAASQEDVESMIKLAHLYETGEGVEKDVLTAMKWYNKAAVYGDNKSCLLIADAYKNGNYGYPKDNDMAFIWYLAAMHFPGSTINDRRPYNVDAELFADIQRSLAQCYVEGVGVERDFGEAAKLYNMAFAEDSVRGQEERFNALLLASQSDSTFRKDLALCYFYGRGTEQNYEEAVRLLSAVVEDDKYTIDNGYGYHESLEEFYALGYCYYYGKGVEQDLPLAVSLLKKSHDERAEDILGNSSHYKYREKDVTEESLQKLKIAAENGDIGAQATVGKYYLLSGKSDSELEEAVKYLRCATAHGDYEAMLMLGYCYYYGKGVEQSTEKARSLYEVWKSRSISGYSVSWSYVNLFLAEMGDDFAQCVLAECLETGNGVDRDEAEAVKWYVKAARNGNEKAREKLTERGVEW